MAVSAADIAPKAFEQLVKQGGDHQDVEDDLQVHTALLVAEHQALFLFLPGSLASSLCGHLTCGLCVCAVCVWIQCGNDLSASKITPLNTRERAAWVATSSVQGVVLSCSNGQRAACG